MKKREKRLISILLSLVLVLTLMPVMSLRAVADGTKAYAAYDATTEANKEKDPADLQVTFDGQLWYIIADDSTSATEGTVTLLTKECVNASQYYNLQTSIRYVEYNNSTVKGVVDGYYNNNISSAAKAAVSGSGMFLLTKDLAIAIKNDAIRRCNMYTGASFNYWWLCSKGLVTESSNPDRAMYVDGNSGKVEENGIYMNKTLGVRPALKLNLAYVDFDSSLNTFTVNKYCPGITDLGTEAMALPSTPTTDEPWNGSYVYYGKYDGITPTKYRVLDKASNDFGVTGKSLLLDCDSVLDHGKFDVDGSLNEGATNPNEWAYSDVRAGLNGTLFLSKSGNFTDVEKGAIAESTKTEPTDGMDGNGSSDLGWVGLSQEKVFLLDAKEATRITYGYSHPKNEAVNRKKNGLNASWWLRSPDPADSKNAGYVYDNGIIMTGGVTENFGVSPAFNISLSSVIFSSLVSGTSGNPGAEYKLTLKDPNLTVAAGVVQDETVNNKYHIPYAITDNSSVSTPTQVSVVVTDGIWDNGWNNVSKFQYTKLDVGTFSLTGTGTFTLDTSKFSGTWGTAFHVYVLAEAVNTGNVTDYASEPLEIKLPSYGLKYNPNGGTGLIASMNVRDNDTFTFPACGFTAPTGKTFDYWDMTGKVDKKFYPDKPENNNTEITNACAIAGIITVTAHWKDLPAATVNTPPAEKNLTYTGSAQELVTAGTATGGTMYYALGATSDIIPEAGWSTDIPKETAAGTYYVWFKAKGDADHSDSVAEPLTATIKNKPSPPSPSPTPSYTYYTVKFEMNGHGEQVSSQTVRSGLKAKEPSDPSADGYTFAGWYGDSDCTKPYDFSTPVTKNTTLYAKWEEIRYTVSFDLDGKGTIAPQSVKQGETAKKPTDPSAEGFTFSGWYLDKDCTKPYDFSTPVTKDITIYAKWEKVVLPVLVHRLYNPNSGEHFYTANDGERDGLVAAGWNHEVNDGFSVPATAASLPVYRLYNPNGNEHIYTTNLDEAVTLSQIHGWIYEGVAFYTADPAKDIPVYRVYNPNSGHHLFTKDKSEVDVLVSLGWIYEGIAWYAVPDSV